MAAVRVDFLYTNIGRGHPYYLDGIIEALVRQGRINLVRGQSDVFEVTHGLCRLGWQVVRHLYRTGSSGGLVGAVYGVLRSEADYNRRTPMLRILGRDIRQAYSDNNVPVVVAHPSLVGILSGKEDIIYQHGEVITPTEAVVKGARAVMVPTEEAARPFLGAGYRATAVIVTGLCVEPSLVKQARDSYEARRTRLAASGPLTGAFFSSGAEPKAHVENLIEAAMSAVAGGGRAILFAAKGGRLADKAKSRLSGESIHHRVIDLQDQIPHDPVGLTLVIFRTRREETALVSRLFHTFDYLVAPPHERTNWALGLGLPMFALTPVVGPFAPLNLKALIDHGVTMTIDDVTDARRQAETVARLQSESVLLRMAEAGWKKYEIDGFARIAEYLGETYGP